MRLICLAYFLPALILAAFSPDRASALSIEPSLLQMQSVGRTSRSVFTVGNQSSRRIPVVISIAEVQLDSSGTVSKLPSSDDFLIFPPQALIAPGGSQAFRIQWVGEPDLARSKEYILGIQQVPLDLEDDTDAESTSMKVQLVYGFEMLVAVDPPAPTFEARTSPATIVPHERGVAASFDAVNSGNAYTLLSKSRVRVTVGSSWSRTYSERDVAAAIGYGLIQPGKSRRFVFPLDGAPASLLGEQGTIEIIPNVR